MGYCGPFYIKENDFRNKSFIKFYVAFFVCMSVKAVYIEVVSDLKTEAFLNVLKWFISRRGFPSNIYSDNGYNIKGGSNELIELHSLLQNNDFNNALHVLHVISF